MERSDFDRLEERRLTIKRRYTENYPAIEVGKAARIRNKMLEAIADGKLSQEDFDAILKEMSTDSKRWLRRNTKYFNVSEDGIALSKFGRRILNKITNPTMQKKLVTESFAEFTSNGSEMINEGTRGQFGIIDKRGNIQSVYTHYDSYPDWVLPTIKKHYKDAKAVKDIIAKGDNSGLDAPDKMNFYGGDVTPMTGKKSKIDAYIKLAANDGGAEYVYLYDEADKKWYMADVYGDRELVPAFESVEVEDAEEVLESEEVSGFEAFVNERNELNEAFKSSKLRNLMNMDQSQGDAYGKVGNLSKALYGLSKIKLDQVEDTDLVDLSPKDAYKQLTKDNDYVVFYIVDNEKENPYADSNSYRAPMLRPGILALTRGKDFLGVQYMQGGRKWDDKRGRKAEYNTRIADGDGAVGGNKKYRGYDASGLYNVKRVAELADRVIAFDITAMGKSAKELIQQRAEAQEGAIAFKSAADFKKANLQRYKDILAQKASKLPLDKMVEDAISELTKQVADAIKKGEKTQYGEIKIGESPKGRDVKITDAANHMSSILGDYERYVRYVADAEKEKDSGFSSGYYEKHAKEYAKTVADRVKKVKDLSYGW